MLNDKCGMRVRIRRSLLFYEISLSVCVCVCNNSIIIYLLPKKEEHLRFSFFVFFLPAGTRHRKMVQLTRYDSLHRRQWRKLTFFDRHYFSFPLEKTTAIIKEMERLHTCQRMAEIKR